MIDFLSASISEMLGLISLTADFINDLFDSELQRLAYSVKHNNYNYWDRKTFVYNADPDHTAPERAHGSRSILFIILSASFARCLAEPNFPF